MQLHSRNTFAGTPLQQDEESRRRGEEEREVQIHGCKCTGAGPVVRAEA